MAEPPVSTMAALQKLTEGGYNFYRDTARQRQDDLFVRARAADALGRAAARVMEQVQAARRAVPAATREQPFADPAVMAGIAHMKTLQARLAALETRLRGPAALPDRDFASVRASAAHCARLVQLDAALVAAAETPGVEQHLDALESVLDARAALSDWSPKR